MPAPIDVLFLAPGLGTGGTETHLARMLPALARSGVRPKVLNAGDVGPAYEELAREGIEVASLPATGSGHRAGEMTRMLVALQRAAASVVHSYLYGRHWLDAVASRMAGLPYIGTRRNMAHWRQGRVLTREKLRDSLSAVIVANSQAAAEQARREGADPARLEIIPNGVPLPGRPSDPACRAAARSELGLPAGAHVIGSVASLKPVKDPQTLLSAFARLTGDDHHLVLVGEGPSRDDLQRRVDQQGLSRRVHLVGQHPEPQRLLPALDVFALMSLQEGCSNALLEAMAQGLPVVATAVGGNIDAVLADRTGILVPPGDDEQLWQALERLYRQPGLRRAFGEAGRRRAEESFSLASMVAAHADLYSRVQHGRVSE